jgi:hypothetical protein
MVYRCYDIDVICRIFKFNENNLLFISIKNIKNLYYEYYINNKI